LRFFYTLLTNLISSHQQYELLILEEGLAKNGRLGIEMNSKTNL